MMKNLGKYCKAYPVRMLREFDGWTEDLENLRKESQPEGGTEPRPRNALKDDDYLYLQENYVVTDGIFIDENIIFGNVTPEWKGFCTQVLKFEVPSYETA